MKKQLFTTLLFFFFLISSAKAQYVTIPDPAMVNWFTAHFPTAMNGNQLDTTFTNLLYVNTLDTTSFYGVNVQNLDGIQYLPNLLFLQLPNKGVHTIPSFPPNLIFINLDFNNIDTLPPLPNSLENIACGFNNLSFLPPLPNSLIYIMCDNNNLTDLPNLPNSLQSLICDHNDISCLPLLPQNLGYLSFTFNYINCLPNYPSSLPSSSLPLCQANNPNGCITTNSISGAVFYDANNDCINNANLTTATTFHLYDDQNNFLQSRSSSFDDNYYFTIQPGNYVVRIDSSSISNSIMISCPISGEYSVVALPDSSYTDRDFGFQCAGVDVGVEAIVQQGFVFPGQPHAVKAFVGDLSNYVGLNCAAGIGGNVQLTVNGPVTYTGYPSTALAPTVSGNTYSYAVSDFGLLSIGESFVLNFVTDTTAQSGDVITVTATISSNSTDLDSTNNFLSYTYNVVNSYDPNMKEVNPTYVLPGYDDYFTYTVHFQNLGSAPAFNIKIKDTLDANLDFSTFRVINASHNYSYNLSGDLLTVYFPNIMLADSASNPEGSKGFVQYQVKPKANLPLGTAIENTAHIFFDFNPAVVTNTTMNQFVNNLSVAEKPNQPFSIYPNPSSGNITLVNQQKGNETVGVEIYDLLGKKLLSESVYFKSGVAHLNLDLISGSYLLVAENELGISSSYRLVVEK
ncbi:MAG: T9SS type A sorting domain-containing protein [Crocinitomicaceae bacterium]